MSDTELDVHLERELREVLRRREPGPVPYDLERRVGRVPETITAQRGVGIRLVPVIAAAAAIVVLLLAVPQLGPAPAGPGASVAVPGVSPVVAASFDPTLVGPGMAVAPAGDPGALVLIAVFLLVVAAALLHGWRRLVPLVPAVLLVGWAVIASQVPVTIETFGSGLGLHTTRAEAPPAFDEDVVYETAPAFDPFSVAIFLRAASAVPVTIEGFVDPARDQEVRGFPVWQAAWLDGEAGSGSTGPATPFVPVVLDAEGRAMHLVGSAGGCAYGPTFDTASPPADVGSTGLDRITVQIRTLGWPRTVVLPLGFELAEPMARTCP